MKPIVFVLSTGRCGTRFLASALRALYADQLEAWHERLQTEACARRYFRRYERNSLDAMRSEPAISVMIEAIAQTARCRPYLETGWTLHSLLPLLVREFGDAVRIVFQVRHPFDVAASLACRGVYSHERQQDLWHKNLFITPEDNVFTHPREWRRWSPFEKSLWRWVELTDYWDELRSRFPDAACDVVRSEDLFRGPHTLRRYADLLKLPQLTDAQIGRSQEAGDRNLTSAKSQYWFGLGREWQRYFARDRVIEVSRRYGYSSRRSVIQAKAPRYRKPLDIVGRTRRHVTALWKTG